MAIKKLDQNQINEKLEEILKALDEAIEDMDKAKVDELLGNKGIDKVDKLAKRSNYEDIIKGLEERVAKITDEINNNTDLDKDDINELLDIRGKITTKKQPFEKTKQVIENLSKKGITHEDLKEYKQIKKQDNETEIETTKKFNQELNKEIQYVGFNYMEKIEENDQAIKIMEEMEKQKKLLEKLNPNTDKAAYDRIKSNMSSQISYLSSIGIDVTSIQNFENDLKSIDAFCSAQVPALKLASDSLAKQAATEFGNLNALSNKFGLDSVKDAQQLKDTYKKMIAERQKNSTKIVKLENENKEIEKTIKNMEKEEISETIGYDSDGNPKDQEDVINNVWSNDELRNSVEQEVDKIFINDKKLFPRFRNRMNYFKEYEELSTIKAFMKAVRTSTKRTKMLAKRNLAYNKGMDVADNARNSMNKRKTTFRESIEIDVSKKMLKNSKLTEKDIKDDVMENAYKKAFDEER